jgi:tetratricopeptide (TPR) repeat protein
MNLRPKTKRRLLMLLTASAVGASVASVGVVIQLHRYENHRLSFRATAMAAYQRGDYRTAADFFAEYLGNDRMDSPAIYDYAVCRSKLPRPDLSHLIEAKALFNRYLELNPGDIDAEHQLLDIYQKLRYSAETTELSDQLLKTNPDDVAALSARLGQLVRQRDYSTALPVAMHLDDLTPDDVQTQSMTYELMQHLRQPPADFIDRADRMLQAHPQDPRFELLRAVASYCTGDRPQTTRWLRLAATRTPPDAAFILMLAGAFDRMELWTDSRDLLEKNAATPSAPPQLKAVFAQRLWEMGQYPQAILLLKNVSSADPASNSDLLGLQALVQFSQNTADPSTRTTVSILQQRQDDMVASAWASLLTAVIDTTVTDTTVTENTVTSNAVTDTTGTAAVIHSSPSDPLQPVRLCQSARRSDPENPDADFFLGREYLRLGETEPALQVLRQAGQMQPEWAAPWLLIARALLQRGQLSPAGRAADAAYQRDPQNPAVQLIFALVHYRLLPRAASAADIRPVLSFVHELRLLSPQDPQLLAAEVDLLARSQQRQNAIDLAAAAVSKPASSMLLQLALIDQNDHLGLTNLLSDRLADCRPTTPGQAVDQVRADLLTGNADTARALISTFAAHPTPGWTLASLQAVDLLSDAPSDPSIAARWRQLVDALPNDLSVQQAAAHSPTVLADRPLMDRTIDRLKTLTGEESIEWKIDRARWQLANYQDTKNSAAAAAASMAEIARLAPDYPPAQEVWADALVKLGDINSAAVHLRLATQIDPDNVALALKLATLYLQQGQFHEVSLLLGSAQANPYLRDSDRLAIALLYRQIADRADAISLLEDPQPIHPDDFARDLLLAQLRSEQGNSSEAQSIYTAWTGRADCPPEVLSAAADFNAAQGNVVIGRRILDRLNALDISPGKKGRILAGFEARFGDKQLAADKFSKAVQAQPGDEQTWLAWAGMYLRAGDFSDAFNVAGEALKHLPASAALSAMKDRAQALAGLQLDADPTPPLLDSLLESLSVDPANPAGAATVNALADSETPGDTLEHLKTVAQSFPQFVPVQAMLIRLDFSAGRYDLAIDRATRLTHLLPIQTEPAELLTRVYSAANRYQQALSSAEEWRGRSLDRPHPADLAIAAAQLGLHQPQAAADQVSWCLERSGGTDQIADHPSASQVKALDLYARALCQEDRADQAWQIVQTYAAADPVWRRRWLQIVSDTAPSLIGGAKRVQQLMQLVQTGSAEDQFALGEAWFALGKRFNDSGALDKAKSLIEPLTDAGAVPAQTWLLLGAIQQQQNDLPDAETALTSAVKLAPDLSAAKNNLAMVMLLRGEDLSAAQKLAIQAVTQAPTSSAAHSTLGEIDQRLNDPDAAKTQFQTAFELNAQNAEALIGLASVQSQAGDRSSASFTLQKAESVLEATHQKLPPRLQLELDQLTSAVTNLHQ